MDWTTFCMVIIISLIFTRENPIPFLSDVGGVSTNSTLKTTAPGLYTRLILSGKLYSVLHDLDYQAQKRYELIICQMKSAEGITEALKAENQLEWVRRMNNIRNRAEELVRVEMIYS